MAQGVFVPPTPESNLFTLAEGDEEEQSRSPSPVLTLEAPDAKASRAHTSAAQELDDLGAHRRPPFASNISSDDITDTFHV